MASPINVNVSIRKPFIWAAHAVIGFAKITLLFTHPCDFVAQENIFLNTQRICLKILTSKHAYKIR